jgi:hypothetical protein
MTRIRLAVLCAVGALIWGGIFGVLSHFGLCRRLGLDRGRAG